MNEKITAAWINIFYCLFRRFGCLCSHFQEIHCTSERNGRILTPTNRNTSTTKRCYTEGERNRGRENDEESNRGTSSSMDTDREGEKQVRVETTDEEQRKFAWPGRRREGTNRHDQAKQHMFGWWRIFVFVLLGVNERETSRGMCVSSAVLVLIVDVIDLLLLLLSFVPRVVLLNR